MSGLVRGVQVEALKVRTARASYAVLATSAMLTLLFSLLEASRAGSKGVAPITTAAGLSTVTTVTGFSMLLAAVLGAMITSGEFRHGTATLTYLAFPERGWVLAAKEIVAAASGAVFGLVSGVVSTAVGVGFAAGHRGALALGAGTLAGHVAGAMLGAALFGAVGAGLGSLVRSQLAGVTALFLWSVVVESVVGGLFPHVLRYMPYTAATSLGGIKPGGSAFGPAHGASAGAPLPFVAAAAFVAGVAVLLSMLASRTTVARDIS